MSSDKLDYKVEYLIDRIYNELEVHLNSSKKISIEKPQVSIANKKTFIANFRNICTKLKRKEEDVRLFFEKELNTTVTINQDGALIITGMYKQPGIINVMTNYIKEYVTCKECGSCDTELIKENRILFVKCNRCLSKKALIL